MRIDNIIETAERYGRFFCKFLSANDIGANKNSHQAGIYIPRKASPLFFDAAGEKGENRDRLIECHFEDSHSITARAIWYGSKTRSEYRITRFWPNSPYDQLEQLGNLLIMIKTADNEYLVYILDKEQEIELFLNHFSISLVQNSAAFGISPHIPKKKLIKYIEKYANSFKENFPSTQEIAHKARDFHQLNIYNPDNSLLKWVEIEYEIFQAIERSIYEKELTTPFLELEKLISFANTVLNRRKSRAGKSLEHHIHFLLSYYQIPFSHPGLTEGKKKPDFILPSNKDYADSLFDSRKLTFLGVKTTCKDRWRQILNEADRIPVKHLLTLQQGISKNQLQEMINANVQLVVPKKFHQFYPNEYKNKLLDIHTFILKMKAKYNV